MNREQKVKEVASLVKKFQSAKAVLLAENKGLKVSEVTLLKKTLKKKGEARIKIVKNRLLKRALQDCKIEGLDPFIEGAVALASSDADSVALAKILFEFVKEHEGLKVKGGYVEGKVLSFERVKALAMLPSREELLSMLLRCLKNPSAQFVNVLAALPRRLVTAMDGIRKQKEKGG